MHRIQSIGVMSSARRVGALYGAMGLLILPIGLIAAAFGALSSGEEGSSLTLVVMSIAVPFLYAACGFVFGAIGAWIYNQVAGIIGGVQIRLTIVTEPLLPPAVD